MADKFTPRILKFDEINNLPQLINILNEELRNISKSINQITDGRHTILNAAPPKIEDGMVIYADGTNFNPGSGRGLYERVSGAWVKL